MALVLITEPSKAYTDGVNTEYCTFNSANRPIEFKFQRKDYIKTTDFVIVNSGGYVGFDLVTTTATKAVAGDLVYFYSGGTSYTSGFYEVLYIDTVNNIIRINLSYVDTGNAADFINVNADRPNYYAEVKITVDSVDYFQKASASSTGLVTVNVSGILRRLLQLKDDSTFLYSDYTTYYKVQVNKETNTVKEFSVTYTERCSRNDISFSSTHISKTFFAVDSTPDITEESLMWRYYLPKTESDINRDNHKWLTLFKSPTMFLWYPFDISILIRFTSLQLPAFKFQAVFKDLNNVVKYNPGLFEFDEANLGTGLYRINPSVWSYWNQNISPALNISKVLIDIIGVQNATQQLNILIDDKEKCNPIYVKWLNKLGAWSYWLFSSKSDDNIKLSGGEQAMTNQSTAMKEFFINGNAERVLTVYGDDLDYNEVEAWQDFIAQENVFIQKQTYWEAIKTSAVFMNMALITTEKPHNLKVGDYVQVLGDQLHGGYHNKYLVTTVTSDYQFRFNVDFTVPFLPTAAWRKVSTYEDWVLCRKENNTSNIQIGNTRFSMSFDLIKPSLTRRLM